MTFFPVSPIFFSPFFSSFPPRLFFPNLIPFVFFFSLQFNHPNENYFFPNKEERAAPGHSPPNFFKVYNLKKCVFLTFFPIFCPFYFSLLTFLVFSPDEPSPKINFPFFLFLFPFHLLYLKLLPKFMKILPCPHSTS